MKNKMKKGLAFLLSFVMVLALTGMQAPVTAKAAEKVAFSCTTKSVAIGGTYTLTVDGVTDTKATYSWSSSKTSVAVVSSKGMITGVAPGSATIQCKITMSDNSTQTLSCKVTVKEHTPATSIAISNAKCDTINAHILKVGESYDFNRTLTPSTSNDKTYWYIQDEDYAEVDSSGVVTAKKEGITMLVAQAGIDRVDAELPTNTIVDYVYLYIVSANAQQGTTPVNPSATPTTTPGIRPSVPTTATPTPTIAPTATVTPTPTVAPTATATPTVTEAPVYGEAAVAHVNLVSFNELQIVFGQPVVKSTILKTNGMLTDCIDIVGRSNALDYGDLTGELSQDGMTLTIFASNGFKGIYQISVFSGIQTTNGNMVATYSEQKRLIDDVKPYCTDIKVDENGYLNTIYFSEPIEIDNMEIVGVENCNGSTKELLQDATNYVLAEDGKSMSIDLSYIRSEDENKDLVVVINGITDKAGNYTSPSYSLQLTLRADTKFRAVANLVSIERISLTEVVAVFDGKLIDAGEMTVGNYTVPGRVDPDNEYRGIYELNDAQMKLTGIQKVTVSKWYSYFATSAADTSKQYSVDFTQSKSSPVLKDATISQKVENDIVITTITLVYDKNVNLQEFDGILQGTFSGSNGYILPIDLTYTAKEDGNKIILTIDDSQMSESGEYMITLPAYFCADTYYNYTTEKKINLKVDVESTVKLPAPYEVVQDDTDASKIYVKFAYMLDKASAETVQNYIINSTTPASATLIEQTQDGATVCLTLSSKAIRYNGTYPVEIKNIKGYGDSMKKMDKYEIMLYLVENTPPAVKSVKLISSSEVVLTFEENIQGDPDFAVYLPGTTKDIASYSYIADDNTVHIELISSTSGKVVVEPTTFCNLEDENGNKAVLKNSYTATKSY